MIRFEREQWGMALIFILLFIAGDLLFFNLGTHHGKAGMETLREENAALRMENERISRTLSFCKQRHR